MIKKYQLIQSDIVLALKYDTLSRMVTLGGNNIFKLEMHILLQESFNLPQYETKQTQKNKVRYIFKKTNRGFNNSLRRVRKNGYITEQVRSLGKIMC